MTNNKYSKIPEIKDLAERIQFFVEIPTSEKEYYKADIWDLSNSIIQDLVKKLSNNVLKS